MATNRIKMSPVSRPLTADGEASGLVTLASNSGIYPTAKGYISSATGASTHVQAIERVGTTQLRLRLADNPYGGGADLSGFLLADGAHLSFSEQSVSFGSVEEQREVSEERYINVDGDTMVGPLEVPRITVTEHIVRPTGIASPDGDIELDTDYVLIDGAGEISTISRPILTPGITMEVTLKFNDEVTIRNMAAGPGLPILLAGRVDLILYSGDTLTLVLNGETWQEKSRARPCVHWKSHRTTSFVPAAIDTWTDIPWDLLAEEETTPAVGFRVVDGDPPTEDNTTMVVHGFSGLINVEGFYRPKWNGAPAEAATVAVRVVRSYDGGVTWAEARCLQSMSHRERQEANLDTDHYAGTLYAEDGTQIKVQVRVSNLNLSLEPPANIFDSPVAASLNMFGC